MTRFISIKKTLGLVICLTLFSSTAMTKTKVQEKDLGSTAATKVEPISSPETQEQPKQVETPSEQKTSDNKNVFVRGFQATSRGVKKVGSTIGNSFKKVGSAIKGVFVKKDREEVGEQKASEKADSQEEKDAPTENKSAPAHDLDSVGNEV